MQNPLIVNQQAKVAKLQQRLELELFRGTLITDLWNSINFEKIDKAFEKLGLKVISPVTANINSNEEISIEELSACPLRVSYRVQSIGSLKGVQFAGYTARGQGKNHDRLIAKAEKIEEKITALTGYICDINYFGMEVKSTKENFQFSVDFRIAK